MHRRLALGCLEQQGKRPGPRTFPCGWPLRVLRVGPASPEGWGAAACSCDPGLQTTPSSSLPPGPIPSPSPQTSSALSGWLHFAEPTLLSPAEQALDSRRPGLDTLTSAVPATPLQASTTLSSGARLAFGSLETGSRRQDHAHVRQEGPGRAAGARPIWLCHSSPHTHTEPKLLGQGCRQRAAWSWLQSDQEVSMFLLQKKNLSINRYFSQPCCSSTGERF